MELLGLALGLGLPVMFAGLRSPLSLWVGDSRAESDVEATDTTDKVEDEDEAESIDEVDVVLRADVSVGGEFGRLD